MKIGIKMKTWFSLIAGASLSAIIFCPVFATSGRTDASGCHTDRKGGTGYHCHNSGKTRAAPATAQTKAPSSRKEVSSDATRSSSNQQSQSGNRPVYYQNCSAARAAGAAPILRGEPGYSRKLDRDNDGIACE